MPAFIILDDTILYDTSKDQADEMPLHYDMHPRVNKYHINGGLSMVSHEVVNGHDHKMEKDHHGRTRVYSSNEHHLINHESIEIKKG